MKSIPLNLIKQYFILVIVLNAVLTFLTDSAVSELIKSVILRFAWVFFSIFINGNSKFKVLHWQTFLYSFLYKYSNINSYILARNVLNLRNIWHTEITSRCFRKTVVSVFALLFICYMFFVLLLYRYWSPWWWWQWQWWRQLWRWCWSGILR